MAYEREELVSIGARFVTRSLTAWAAEIIEAARRDLDALKRRGITEGTFKDVHDWLEKVQHFESHQEAQKRDLAPYVARRLELLDQAFDWRQELLTTVHAIFDSEPDVQARFRTGVKLSASLPKAKAELERLLPEVHAHLPALRGGGIDPEFVKTGEKLAGELDALMTARAGDRAELRPATEELYHAQGVLYTKVRFIARIARAAFRKSPERARRYGYSTLERGETAAKGARTRAAQPVS